MNQSIKTSHSIIGLVATVVIVGVLVFVGTAPQSDAVALKLSPASKSAAVNSTLTVDIVLNTAGKGVYGVDVNRLRFDPRVFQVVDADPAVAGTQIASGKLMPATVFNSVDNTAGTIQFSQVQTQMSDKDSFNGSGILATVTFKVISAGTSDVTLDFTPGSSTDSNVAGAGVDLLSAVVGGSYVGTSAPF